MGEYRQPHLNGDYYHRRDRGGGDCGCCKLFSCLCACLYQIICTILVVLVIVGFILWLIFRPNVLKFYATDASLTEFNLDNSTIHYRLALNLTIRNPNRRIGIHYDHIEASAYYQGQKLTTVELHPFYQGRKNTSMVKAEFSGHNAVTLGNGELSNYQHDRNSGKYNINVKLHLRIRLMFWFARLTRMNQKIDCGLSVPLHSNGTSSGVYESKRCDFGWS